MRRAGVPERVGSVVRELYLQPSHECLKLVRKGYRPREDGAEISESGKACG
jgi:hypothetical protein